MENDLMILLDKVQDFGVMKKDDASFLVENKDHLMKVFDKVYMWRTESQKRSILSDSYHPTLHGKFHQAIAEQKVQLDQAFYLAKDFEMKKLEIEELLLDVDELAYTKRDDIIRKKKMLEINFKQYELKQMEIAMNYRMEEVKGWQELQNEILDLMKTDGMSEDEIWNKNIGEVEDNFFLFLTNLCGLPQSTDGGEVQNLYALARFGVRQAKQAGVYDKLITRCNKNQLWAIDQLKATFGNDI